MKKYIVIISLILLQGCYFLVPPASRVDYYKPVDVNIAKIIKKNAKGFKVAYYGPILIDSLRIYVDLSTGSHYKVKIVSANLSVSNPYNKQYILNTDSLYITSGRLDTIKYREANGKKEQFSQAYDSIVYRFGKGYQIGDFNWYRKMKKTDTLFLNFEINNKKIQIPFYYKKKKALETYPY